MFLLYTGITLLFLIMSYFLNKKISSDATIYPLVVGIIFIVVVLFIGFLQPVKERFTVLSEDQYLYEKVISNGYKYIQVEYEEEVYLTRRGYKYINSEYECVIVEDITAFGINKGIDRVYFREVR